MSKDTVYLSHPKGGQGEIQTQELGTANLSTITVFCVFCFFVFKISYDSEYEPETVWEFEKELSFRGNDSTRMKFGE